MIYFVRFDSGSIKIGFSKRPFMRSQELRTAFGTKTEILATEEGDRGRERELHERFAHLRINKTEQFRPGPDLIAYLKADPTYALGYQSVEAQPHNPNTAKLFVFRLGPECLRMIDELAKIWGPVKPLTRSAVVSLCIDKCYEQEMAKSKVQGEPAREGR